MKKILIAMSGGVDSAVAAYMLKKEYENVCAATLMLFDTAGTENDGAITCGSSRDAEDAKKIADDLGIEHNVLSYRDAFAEKVIDKFVRTYFEGGTPNPCIDCNRYIKFGALLKKAEEMGCSAIATGHYARRCYDEKSGRYLLKKAADYTKDQSYVLYSLTQEQLKKIYFPLGDLKKTEVRKIAEENGFHNAHKADSQDICFVKDGDYARFIEEYTGKKCPCGEFVRCDGTVLGTHKGHIHYTIGQRKGLGLSVPEPVYVCSKNIEENKVIVDTYEHTLCNVLIAEDVNLISVSEITDAMTVSVRTRYKQKETEAKLYNEENGILRVEFSSPVKAITPGQAVVFYDGDIVVGGGTIKKQGMLK